MPCESGQKLNKINGCVDCLAGQYSAGGTTESCTACPEGKISDAGSAGSADDCRLGIA